MSAARLWCRVAAICDWQRKDDSAASSKSYIWLPLPHLAMSRVAARVKQGGHNVARSDVLRRYKRGWTNFLEVYRPLADHWTIYDNSEATPQLLERGP
jgi:predicted ABC-type ATPase